MTKSHYKLRLDRCDWYGGDNGYGINCVFNDFPLKAESDKDALRQALFITKSLTRLKTETRITPKRMCSAHVWSKNLKDDDGRAVVYHIQYLHRYQHWYVFTMFAGDYYMRAYRLHDDGTLGRWNGLY